MKVATIPKGRILCTEDDPDSRALLVFVLENNGYLVTCPKNSADALSLAEHEQFDLLLVDNWMPGLSGQELTRQVREFNKKTPILFFSGAAYESDKQEARNAGAQGYLIKPFGISELTHEVARLIGEAKTSAM